jgi:phosphoribosyl 1,2-cyclic phosphate phosphodiesterase
MRIQILGTAAAEGWPAVFCGCQTCLRARAAGGKDIRSRSSVQIDNEIKIDLPPDTYYHSVRHNIEFSRLKHLFITHSRGPFFPAGARLHTLAIRPQSGERAR